MGTKITMISVHGRRLGGEKHRLPDALPRQRTRVQCKQERTRGTHRRRLGRCRYPEENHGEHDNGKYGQRQHRLGEEHQYHEPLRIELPVIADQQNDRYRNSCPERDEECFRGPRIRGSSRACYRVSQRDQPLSASGCGFSGLRLGLLRPITGQRLRLGRFARRLGWGLTHFTRNGGRRLHCPAGRCRDGDLLCDHLRTVNHDVPPRPAHHSQREKHRGQRDDELAKPSSAASDVYKRQITASVRSTGVSATTNWRSRNR